MNIKIKKLKNKRRTNIHFFLNYIMYNKLRINDQSIYTYYSPRYRGNQNYHVNDKLISTMLDFSKIEEYEE